MKVTLDNYQHLSERTSATATTKGRDECIDVVGRQTQIRLLHGAMGLCTEAGELQDTLKKHIFYDADLDKGNIIEECGDVLWYVAEILNALNMPMQDVMQKNIDKLAVRYPEKFVSKNALNRDIEKEHEVFDIGDSIRETRIG